MKMILIETVLAKKTIVKTSLINMIDIEKNKIEKIIKKTI